MPALLIDRSVKVATPLTAAFGLVPDKVPVPGSVWIARVIEVVAVVTVLPAASWTATSGWVDQTVPIAPPPGCWRNPSLDATPKVMLNAVLVAPVRPAADAVSV